MDNSHVAPRVGLALAGGASRGFAHVGLIDYLNHQNLKVSQVVGTSSGSIVAALMALGHTADSMMELVAGFRFRNVCRFTWPRFGLSRTSRLERFFKSLFGDKTFSSAEIPLKIIAADLDSGEEVVFEEGPLWLAVSASCCIPVIFEPVQEGSRRLVDGGVLAQNPTEHLDQVDKIIGTHLGLARQRLGPVTGINDYVRRTIELFAAKQMIHNNARADVMVHPQVLDWPFLDFSNPLRIRALGWKAAEEKKDEILALYRSNFAS